MIFLKSLRLLARGFFLKTMQSKEATDSQIFLQEFITQILICESAAKNSELIRV
ncbi:MAG: hypothetical protein JWP12_901 [Bacteroidetes bacterium]|nr:hypothetical protein [Bacteroidota bacterium]